MKKFYQLLFLLIGSATFSNAQSFGQDSHNYTHAAGGQSPAFANDIIIAPSSLRQHTTSVAVAFNGWVYESTGVETMNSDSSGGIVRRSKDNGYTWTTIISYLVPHVDYISPEIEVAGTDTNNLALFIAGAWYDSTNANADVWVDKYNATTGVYIGEFYSEGFQNAIRDVDLATDYRSPAWGSSPYSVGLLYSHYGSVDSIIFISSGDGGNTWGNRRGIAGTTQYFDQVSLSYGITGNWGNGRYFAAWEERNGFSTIALGNIKTAHCNNTYGGSWSTPFCLDSLDASITGFARNPRIACLYNSTTDNDSAGITVDVIFERAYGGDTADCDILGFYSKTQPSTNNWYRFDLINNSSQTLQPDISYDPTMDNFLVTYFNRSGQAMPYLVHNYNMITPYTWINVISNYCDQPSSLKNPYPRLAINPAATQAVFSWTSQATSTRDQAMFDAENAFTATQVVNESDSKIKLYPNPAHENTLFTFELLENEKVHIDIYDMTGKLVMNVIDQNMTSGSQEVSIPLSSLSNGTYFLCMTTNSKKVTTRLIVEN